MMSSAMSCHRFFCQCPTGSSENFGALMRVLKSACALGVFKADSRNSYVCAGGYHAHTKSLAAGWLTGSPFLVDHRFERAVRRLGAYAKMRLLSRRRALDDKGRRGSGGSSLAIRIQIQPRYSWSTLARKASTPKTSFQSHSRSRLRKSWASWIPSMSDGVGEHCAWRACRPILIGGMRREMMSQSFTTRVDQL
jgi:hypothetical protein